MRHPVEEQIEMYCLGRVSGEEAANIDLHILACHLCQVRVLLEEDFIAALNSTVDVV
jgi:hypothetical protein